jgi:hypothetical protein
MARTAVVPAATPQARFFRPIEASRVRVCYVR